jgi:hypothetical protein
VYGCVIGVLMYDIVAKGMAVVWMNDGSKKADEAEVKQPLYEFTVCPNLGDGKAILPVCSILQSRSELVQKDEVR